MYEKDFANAIFTLSKLQEEINNYDEEEIRKINWTLEAVFNQFLAFGHSQKQDETIETLNKIKDLRSRRLEIQLENAIDEKQKERFISNTNQQNLGGDIWYNILFGNYEIARDLMQEFKRISEKQLSNNPRDVWILHV